MSDDDLSKVIADTEAHNRATAERDNRQQAETFLGLDEVIRTGYMDGHGSEAMLAVETGWKEIPAGEDWIEIGRLVCILGNLSQTRGVVWSFGSGDGTEYAYAGTAAAPGREMALEVAGDHPDEVLREMINQVRAALLQPGFSEGKRGMIQVRRLEDGSAIVYQVEQ